MPKLLDSDDEGTIGGEDTFNINENYATAYERWRQKEEYQKLKDKYGEDILSEDSVASYDDDESDESSESESVSDVNEAIFDEQFLKVYGALKAKDPLIYDSKVRFFDKKDEDGSAEKVEDADEPQVSSKEKKKSKGMNLLEYHRNLVVNEKGITEEDRLLESGGFPEKPHKSSYVQEMENIKKEFKSFLDDDGDEEELIVGVKQIPTEKAASPADVLRKAAQSDEKIGFLANYWSKKDLDNREQFLKDYILNRKYLDPADREQNKFNPKVKSAEQFANMSSKPIENESSEDDDDDGDDDDNKEMNISERLTNLNDKTAYHFQETNAEVIKRYPREVESVRNIASLGSRNLRRAEIKERKAKEKQEALQRFRELRRAEVRAKLAKLKEISGNDRLLAGEEPDIDAIVDDITNFDPDKYDQCMSKLFDEKFYDVSGHSESIKKPTFDFIPGIDDVDDNLNPINQEAAGHEVEEEDEDAGDDGTSNSRKKNKKKKKKGEKTPADKKNIGIYEDVIAGEIPTRFRYREVPANDFGLTPEELLFADDKELNRWVSLKKTCQYRPMEEETYDIKIYGRRANDINLKQRILKSVYDPQKESTDADDNEQEEDDQQDEAQHNNPSSSQTDHQQPGKRKRSSKRKRPVKKSKGLNLTAERLRSYDLPSKVIKKLH
ncbi:protein KRI1 homolog [Tetranychus urticae]|uniref:Protein KRI1 homolog n=1 Tax=Tetranychus urticae TaxID=32264 RepID=T1KYX5_TETUR|nr:protein KRI1 homolog [Tetranychus urticae]